MIRLTLSQSLKLLELGVGEPFRQKKRNGLLPFREAREAARKLARSLGITTVGQWKKIKPPIGVPRAPENAYIEFISYRDFIGVRRPRKIIRRQRRRVGRYTDNLSETTKPIFEFIEENGTWPKSHNNGAEDKLRKLLGSLRTAKRRDPAAFREVDKEAESLGFPRLFDLYANKGKGKTLRDIEKIAKFIKRNKRKPRGDSRNREERPLGQLLYSLRSAKRVLGRGGTTTARFHPEYEVKAEELGIEGILRIDTPEEDPIDGLKKILRFIRKNKRYPRTPGPNRDKEEVRLRRSLEKLRSLPNGALRERLSQMATEQGMEILFWDGKPPLYSVIQKVKGLIGFIKRHGYLPRFTKETPKETLPLVYFAAQFRYIFKKEKKDLRRGNLRVFHPYIRHLLETSGTLKILLGGKPRGRG